MKKILSLLLGFVALISFAAESPWLLDLPTAQKQAAAEKKMILVYFTGSDWVPQHAQLEKDIFSQAGFNDFAAKNLILLYCDFPRKAPLPPEQLKKNKALIETYRIAGAPTILLLDSEGNVLAKTAPEPQTLDTYLAGLQRLMTEKPYMKLQKERQAVTALLGSFYKRSFVAALDQARSQKANLLLIFQDTDYRSMDLENKILASKSFQAFLGQKIVPFYIDLAQLPSSEEIPQLEEFVSKLKLPEIKPPFMVLCDARGESFGKLIFSNQTEAKVVEDLQRIEADKPDVKARLEAERLRVESLKYWLFDFDAAKKKAAAEKKVILVNFSGSDWCHWCETLSDEVLQQPEFIEYAKKNLVLMLCDFPQEKPLPEAVAKQNVALQEKYQTEGFPTILLLDSTGKEIGRTGYQEGGPVKYVEHLKSIINGTAK